MALRTIDYTVSLSGISPATQQFGGVQGEHNATALKFTLNADLLAAIKDQAGENKVVYRFDVYDGAGGLTSTDSVPLIDSPPSYLLENKVSRMGGNVQVFLIITEIKDGETQMDLYSFPAVLRLKEKQEGEVSEVENYESISTLAEVAKESASIAENSAAIAKEAQIKTEKSKLALESGTVWVFDGGRPSGKIDIDLVVDSTLDPQSQNPLQNDIITEEFKKVSENIQGNAASVKVLTEQIAKILLDYITSEDADMRYLKHEDAADYIVEQGTSGIWTYEKRASGIAECWGNMVCSYSNQSLLIGGCALPFRMTEYNIQGTLQYKETENIVDQRTLKMYDSNQTIYCHIYSDTLFPESYWLTVYVRIKGKWK
jgi:hypothetical protein